MVAAAFLRMLKASCVAAAALWLNVIASVAILVHALRVCRRGSACGGPLPRMSWRPTGGPSSPSRATVVPNHPPGGTHHGRSYARNPAKSPTATLRSNWCASPRPPRSPPRAGSVSARRTRPTAPPSRRCAGRSTQVAIAGTVVIGEGEMDEAPMLYIGEKVGAGGPPMDIAVDPLEGTTLTSKGGPSALAVVALAEHGNFLHAPDIYMDKIAVGGGLPDGVVDLDAPVGKNLRELAAREEVRGVRPGGLHPRSRPPQGADRQGARGRRAHHADQRRRHHRRGRHRYARIRRSTSILAPAARPKACWRPRRCAASAGRCRGG